MRRIGSSASWAISSIWRASRRGAPRWGAEGWGGENLFGRVAARHEPDAKARGITLSTSVAAGAEIVYGDALRIEQALQNLAANALRHTPPGGEVELRAEIDGDEVLVSIRDTGAGIPSEHLPFVFDRFYKADSARAGSNATG